MVSKLTLRAGSIFAIEQPDGTLGGEQRLEEDIEVDLLSDTVAYRVYRRDDGAWLYVKPEDDAPPPTT